MKKRNRLAAIILGLVSVIVLLAPLCLANSAKPPGLTIIIHNAPDDLTLTVLSGGKEAETLSRSLAWESYYLLYDDHIMLSDSFSIRATTGGESFECAPAVSATSYNNEYTLNLANRTLSAGKSVLHTGILVVMRLILTLLIEGALFWAFGFREKKSWFRFLIINLITQGALHIWLGTFEPLNSYLIFVLVFGEFWVFLAEMIAMPLWIREKRGLTKVLYAFVANLASLILGGFLITLLPV